MICAVSFGMYYVTMCTLDCEVQITRTAFQVLVQPRFRSSTQVLTPVNNSSPKAMVAARISAVGRTCHDVVFCSEIAGLLCLTCSAQILTLRVSRIPLVEIVVVAEQGLCLQEKSSRRQPCNTCSELPQIQHSTVQNFLP